MRQIMIQELLSSGPLNLIYVTIATISFLFSLLNLLGLDFGDGFDFDVGSDFLSISPFALSMFGATFGAIGLVTRLWLEMSAIPSILSAIGSGLVAAIAAQVFFILVLSPTRSSHYSLQDDAIGREAEVTITIPADGQGRIGYNNVSGRVTLGARSQSGEVIPAGQIVIIERIMGRVALVRPLDTSAPMK
jgi:membrane protein implicated in regulation of membrane protease activity